MWPAKFAVSPSSQLPLRLPVPDGVFGSVVRSTRKLYLLLFAVLKGSGSALSFTYNLPSPAPNHNPASAAVPVPTFVPVMAGFGKPVGTRPVKVALGTYLTNRQHDLESLAQLSVDPPSPVLDSLEIKSAVPSVFEDAGFVVPPMST